MQYIMGGVCGVWSQWCVVVVVVVNPTGSKRAGPRLLPAQIYESGSTRSHAASRSAALSGFNHRSIGFKLVGMTGQVNK
jgi:hypothetical protein